MAIGRDGRLRGDIAARTTSLKTPTAGAGAVTMAAHGSRARRSLPGLALAAALLLATWPAWRVLTLGDNPTLEELLQLVCSSRR